MLVLNILNIVRSVDFMKYLYICENFNNFTCFLKYKYSYVSNEFRARCKNIRKL